uniref:(northern house mosquito) hypothetical protein n=1 Tax=Culex pipiens TaxID=7175 RepID=A0A8D8BD60_CULPI
MTARKRRRESESPRVSRATVKPKAVRRVEPTPVQITLNGPNWASRNRSCEPSPTRASGSLRKYRRYPSRRPFSASGTCSAQPKPEVVKRWRLEFHCWREL